ncbi:hypothetical protein EDB80DRAFT_218097 [Ilyonectria destructans]|nr:hypothetical protein EDB80DRAFT_218097 [Ilyonectria destructans]
MEHSVASFLFVTAGSFPTIHVVVARRRLPLGGRGQGEKILTSPFDPCPTKSTIPIYLNGKSGYAIPTPTDGNDLLVLANLVRLLTNKEAANAVRNPMLIANSNVSTREQWASLTSTIIAMYWLSRGCVELPLFPGSVSTLHYAIESPEVGCQSSGTIM